MAKELDVSRLVRTLRDRLSLTQEQFAGKLGVTFTSVNRWENGRSKPSPLALKQIETLVINLGRGGKDLRDEFFKD